MSDELIQKFKDSTTQQLNNFITIHCLHITIY